MEVNFYQILVRHFQETTGPDEEKLIAQYKSENPFEYLQFRKLWGSELELDHVDFDVDKAWEKLVFEKTKIDPVIAPLQKRRFLRVAASLLLLICAAFLIDQLIDDQETTIVEITASQVVSPVVLEDGSSEWLNDGAVLRYSANFNKNERLVELEGEAFFEVARDIRKPFTVKAGEMSTKVLGTSFNVNDKPGITKVSVVTGKVEVKNSTGKTVLLTPGLSASSGGDLLASFPTDNPNFLSWKTGIFSFKEQEISLILQDLNTFYNDSIHFENAQLPHCMITAELDNVALSEIIEIIHLTCDIEIAKSDSGYLVK